MTTPPSGHKNAEVVFVMSERQNAFFRELADVLCEEVRAAGARAEVSLDGFPPLAPGRIYALLPPHEYKAVAPEEWPGPPKLARTIFITAEQPGSTHFDDNIAIARGAGARFDLNRLALREYERRGVEVEHLPLGYAPAWDSFGSAAERDLDVLFMGTATTRRLRHLAAGAAPLAGARTRLLLAPDGRPATAGSPGFASGPDKQRLLSRTRVLLNLHRSDEPYFEWLRALEAIHAGVALVSEPSLDIAPLEPGVHFVEGEPGELARLAVELAADDERRERIARAAYEAIRESMPLRDSAARLVAAAGRLLEAPPPRGARVRVMAKVAGERALAAVREGVESAIASTRTPGAGEPMLRAALKELRLEMIQTRRKVQALERSLSGGNGGDPREAETGVVTDRRGDGPPPRTTVICALYNHAGHVGEALDSIAAQTDPDWEVVVCDDGSTDGSGEVVERWIEAHPDAPAALVRHPVNRGLPHARNTAIAHARGEHVLVLDADNSLFPRCIERLAGALDADPEAAFAYGILEQFDQSGPVGLEGWRAWAPAELAERNYIDALAVVRRRVLEELGGYTDDRRLYGWEDYELWCRIAEAGMSAAHVPEIVARYRLAAGSMITLTGLSVRSAWDALAETCPTLFAGREQA